MKIEGFVINDDWTLTFDEQNSCCYCGDRGALVINNVLIVDPRVDSIECSFSGKIEEHYFENGKSVVHKVIVYDTVVFPSAVSIDLSSLAGLKEVFFLKGASSIRLSKPNEKDKLPKIRVGHQNEEEIVSFCSKNNIDVYYAFGMSTYHPIE